MEKSNFLLIFISPIIIYIILVTERESNLRLNTSWTRFTLGAISVPRLPLSPGTFSSPLLFFFFSFLFSRIIEC